MSREIDWRTIVQRVDPAHHRTSNYVAEYQFSAPARMSQNRSGADPDDEASYEATRKARTFYGKYKERGPYIGTAAPDHGLTWNGARLTWNGIPLTWDNG